MMVGRLRQLRCTQRLPRCRAERTIRAVRTRRAPPPTGIRSCWQASATQPSRVSARTSTPSKSRTTTGSERPTAPSTTG